jgi:hypothetical protein
MNGEHYLLLCDMLLQKQLEDLSKLSPQESFNSRQKILNLLWPKTHPVVITSTIGTNSFNKKLSDKKSKEYKICYARLQERVDKQMLNSNSQEYKDYYERLKSRVYERIKNDPNSQEYKDHHDLVQKQIDAIIAFSRSRHSNIILPNS